MAHIVMQVWWRTAYAHPGSSLLIGIPVHLLSWHVMLICRGVCSSVFEGRTDLEQISASYIPPWKVIIIHCPCRRLQYKECVLAYVYYTQQEYIIKERREYQTLIYRVLNVCAESHACNCRTSLYLYTITYLEMVVK